MKFYESEWSIVRLSEKKNSFLKQWLKFFNALWENYILKPNLSHNHFKFYCNCTHSRHTEEEEEEEEKKVLSEVNREKERNYSLFV